MRPTRKAKEVLETIFENYATFIAYNPWKVVFVTVLLHFLFGICLLNRRLNNDIAELYTPSKIVTDKRITKLEPFYPDKTGTKFSALRTIDKPFYAEVIISKTERENQTNELTNDDIQTVVQTVENIAIPTRYHVADLARVCALWDDKCVISTSTNADYEYLKTNFHLDHDVYFGMKDEFPAMLSLNDTTHYSASESTAPVKIRFWLRHDTDAYYEDADLWQHAFVRKFKKWDSENITVHFSHSGSFLQEVGNDTYPDIRLFSLAVAIFITYCGFLISGGDCVSKRVHLGRMGVINVPLGVLGAWGFMAGVGMTFTNIVGVMPYFLVFHEINLVMSVLSEIGNNLDETEGPKRVIKAVKDVAVTSTALLVVHVTPFVFCTFSRYEALETLGIYTVVTMLSNFLTHYSFFIGCLAIHENRIDENRHCCTCKEVRLRDDPELEGRTCCFRCCCSGRRPTEREQVESFLERLPRRLFSRFLLLRPVQCALVLLLLTCAGASIWRVMGTTVGTIQETDVTPQSYFREYYDVNNPRFTETTVFTVSVDTGDMIFTKTVDQQTNIDRLISIYKTLTRIPIFSDNEGHQFWLEEYHKPGQNYTSEKGFLKQVKQFLDAREDYRNDVVWNNDEDSITRFRFYLVSNTIGSWVEAINARKQVKNLVDDEFDDLDDMYDVEARVHAPSLWLIDSYKQPMYELAIFAGVQLGVILILLIMFGTSLLSLVHAIFWYSLSVIGILACLTTLGVNLNIVTVMYIMVGLCYCAEVIMYYIFSCMYSEGMDNASRVYNVVQKTTPILFNTTLASFLGLTILFLVKSFVFVAVLKVIGTCIAVACLLSFAFMPSVLGLIGIGRPLFFKSEADKAFSMDIASMSRRSSAASTVVMDRSVLVSPKKEEGFANGFDNKAYVPEPPRGGELTKL